jgi:hypothetical protein
VRRAWLVRRYRSIGAEAAASFQHSFSQRLTIALANWNARTIANSADGGDFRVVVMKGFTLFRQSSKYVYFQHRP